MTDNLSPLALETLPPAGLSNSASPQDSSLPTKGVVTRVTTPAGPALFFLHAVIVRGDCGVGTHNSPALPPSPVYVPNC